MRQLHETKKTDTLTKKLEEAGFTPANVEWMTEYLAFGAEERPELLERAQRQSVDDFFRQQRCHHCVIALEYLLNQGNVDIQNRAVKAFYAVLGTGLTDERIMQARSWTNLFAKLTTQPMDRLLGPAATLALYAGAWRGNSFAAERVRKAQPEEIKKALECCGGAEDPARVVLACAWLAQKGPEKNSLFKTLTGKKEDHKWAEDMAREGVIALLPRMVPGLLSGDENLLADYIRQGSDGPLPRLSGTLMGRGSTLHAAMGSACFWAMEAAPALQSAFLACCAVSPSITPQFTVELAGETRFRAKLPWMARRVDLSHTLAYFSSADKYRSLAVDIAKQYPELFERLLASQQLVRSDSPVANVFREAQPERYRRLYSDARPKAMARAIESLTSKIADPAPYKRFLKTGEGIEALIPGHILGHGNFPLYGYSEVCTYGREYGLDDFVVRSLIVSAMSTTLYGVSSLWTQVKTTVEERNIGNLMDRMLAQGLQAYNCLAVAGVIYDGTYHDAKKRQIEKEALQWLLRHPEKAVEEAVSGTVFARCAAAGVLAARKDFDGLIAMAADSSKQVRSAVAGYCAALPSPQVQEMTMRLLEAKKVGQRETGVLAAGGLSQASREKLVQENRPRLEAALSKEKNAKVAASLRQLLGVREEGEAAAAAAPSGDPVKEALKGGKKRKVQWVLDGVAQQGGAEKIFDAGQNKWTVDGQTPGTPGAGLDEDRLAAVMVCCAESCAIAVTETEHAARSASLRTARSLAQALDQRLLTAYAQAVYDLWMEQKAPAKQKWVLTFAALFGGRDMVETLKRQISQWPLEARGAMACEAVNALALSPEPEALLLVDSMSRKFKFKQVKAAAGRALEYAAKALGLTAEELADRIVPDLGLDRRGNRTFDYGPRSFTVTLTPALETEVRTAEGKKLKTLPAVGKQDDPEKAEAALAEFKALKKQIKATVSTQALRLEQALSTGRTWTVPGWKSLFVEKPVMRQFAVGLLWGVYEDGKLAAAFRYLEDGSFGTIDEDEYTLPEEAKVGLVHPVELDAESLAAWKQQLEDYEIRQPFPQLERTVTRPEHLEETAVEIFGGKMLNALSLMGKMQSQGWYRGAAEDGGVFMEFYREDGPFGAQLNFSGAYAGGEDTDVEVWDIWFYRTADIYRGASRGYVKKENRLRLSEVPSRLFSEIVYQVRKATASSTETREDWKARMEKYL